MLWLSPDISGLGTYCPVEHYLCEVLVPNFRTCICLLVQQGFSFIYLFLKLDPKVIGRNCNMDVVEKLWKPRLDTLISNLDFLNFSCLITLRIVSMIAVT